MKKILLILVAFTFFCCANIYAKKLPTVAAKLPTELKEVITEQLQYPDFAEDNYIEGVVWMRICVTEASVVKIVDISASNQELGAYVKKELSSLYIEKPGCKKGQVFYLKVKFDLLD